MWMCGWIVLGSVMASTVMAQVPQTVDYQGRLVDAAGTPLNGPMVVVVDGYGASTGGTSVFSESHSVAMLDGYFSLSLGADDDLAPLLDETEPWIEITVDGVVLAPRQSVGSVPFSRVSAQALTLVGGTGPGSGLDADTVDGIEASDLALAADLDVVVAQVANAALPYSTESTLGHVAAVGMCSGMVSGFGYGSMLVVRSNGVSCNTACDAQDVASGGPYSNFYCYGSVSLGSAQPESRASNQVVAAGWYGNNYCGGTNGMSTFCCCKSNYVNTK
jgi:hypothetical protein